MPELTRFVSSSGSLNKQGCYERRESDIGLVPIENKERISPTTVRTGVFLVLDSIEDLNDDVKMKSALSSFPEPTDEELGPVNVMYIFVLKTDIVFSALPIRSFAI